MSWIYDTSAWSQPDSEHLVSIDGAWSLTHRVDLDVPGWYLTGPNCPVPDGEWLDVWPLCARLDAEFHIAAYRAATTDITTGETTR